jgi:M6 family metalloprotease-like protein
MKKIILTFVIGLLCVVARAIPADPTPMAVAQPDGTTLTVVLHGDEFFHFSTTVDGYTVVKNAAGYYTYARLNGDRLEASDRIARDPLQRSAADHAALKSIPKHLTSPRMSQSGTQMLGRRNAAMRRVGAEGTMDYENFRGLIILINYSNKQFSMTNASDFYDDMVNTHDYTGYTLNNRRVNMTGSVRDYYYDNSAHQFDPHFDVVGPVNVPYSCTYPQSTSNADAIFHAALDSVDKIIDFSDYDVDEDGYVDMVFFLVAGFSANYSGNNQNYLWPHMFYLYNERMRDGVRFGLYACSTEIAVWEGYYSDVNGIGTFCHEFGHVLGLPDLYDTDYSGSGGESRNPGNWSIMAGGSGSNFGRNPVGYSLYERYALGFTQPVLLDSAGIYNLQALDECNQGYRLNTPNENEYFLIENRQAGKWDRFLPGSGMMIARVDSTNESVWWSNEVNCDPKHMYYELLRANYTGQDSEYDPFPGAAGVTSISNFTTPNLLTWNKNLNDYAIFDISDQNGLVSFSLRPDTSILSIVEDFENMPVTTNLSAKGVKGVFSKWDFSKSAVTEVADSTWCNGHRAVAMKKPSMISTTAPLNIIPYSVKYTVYNPTTTTANFRLSYSLDKGETWISLEEGVLSVPSKSSASTTVSLPTDAPIMLRINQTSGNSNVACYLDDIKLYYTETWPVVTFKGDVNSDGEVNIADVNELLGIIANETGDGNLELADVNEDGEINIADVNALVDMILQ